MERPATRIKRVYLPPERSDGMRILVDRLWPRGIDRRKARIAAWLKEIGPSNELRQWFSHDPRKWAEFKKRYFAELKANKGAVGELRAELKKGAATLLFASKEERFNNAVALLEYVKRRRGTS